MFARSVRFALVLAVAPVALAAQGFSYAPATGQYRITSTMKGAQEVMGQRQEIEQSSNQLLTITVERGSPDTLTVTTRLDSIAVVGPMGMTPPGLDQLHGFEVVSKVSPTGLMYSAAGGPDSVPNKEQLTDEMGGILPKLRANLAPGVTWTDTTSRTVKQQGMDIERKVVATYTVAGDTTVNGQSSWKITRAANTALSGSGAPQGQPMTVEGTSVGKGTVLVSRTGVFLGGENEEQVTMKILLAANGMEVGMTQNAVTKIEKVK